MTSEQDSKAPEEGALAEAETRAHDRVSPDTVLDSISAVNLYGEAFVTGTRFVAERREAVR